jgi:GNAT superfamily N-acetyltransferase
LAEGSLMPVNDPGAPGLVEVTDARSGLFEAAMAIYEAEIPKAEQKTRAQILASLAHPDVRFWAFVRGGEAIGVSIVYAPRREGVLLLEYLAVAAKAQGGGIGSALFTASFEASRIDPGTMLLIEVDSEEGDVDAAERAVRLKRKQFYRRLGCREVAGFDYILPLDNYGPAPKMNLLVLGAEEDRLETARLKQAVRAIYQNVYACAPDDPRLAAMFAGLEGSLQLV